MIITPEALERSKYFRKATVDTLRDRNATHDEAFIFIYPSKDILNEMNGDGDLIEIIDYSHDYTVFYLADNSKIRSDTPDLKIYVR